MLAYTLEEVVTQEQKKEFLDFAKRLYKNDPNWVCPFDNDIEKIFDPAQNELFSAGEAVRWLLKNQANETVGRIAAFYNLESAAASDQPTGGCGFFECINDTKASRKLFDAAKQWLLSKGMEAMDGPINFGDRSDWWGVLVEGFTQPLYANPYNFPYYQRLFEDYGFQNYFNQYSYLRELVYGKLNPALVEKADRIYATPGYRFEIATAKKLEDYAEDFTEVYNKAWAFFTGVKPITVDHARKLLKNLKLVIDRKLIYFAYFEDRPIGFFVMFPDLNRIIGRFNGKFSLREKIRFIYELKVRRSADRIFGMIFGVTPEFQGKGVESGIIRMFEKTVFPESGNKSQYKTMELAWVGDFNPVMMRMVESYVCATKYKTHVTYRYLFDREKEFTRSPRMGKSRTK